MKPFYFFALCLSTFIAACAAQAEMGDPQTLSYGNDQGQFIFKSPDGYCIERSSLRTVQGQLNAEVEFTEVIASNCKIVDGKASFLDAENIISTSVSQTSRSLDDEIKLLTGISPLEFKAVDGGYSFSRDEQGVSFSGMVSKIDDYLVYIRVSHVSTNGDDDADELLMQTYQALLEANS